MKTRILLIVGIFLLVFGAWNIFDGVKFIRRSDLVTATVEGFSSMHGLEKEKAECSAYNSSCAVSLSYTLKDGSTHHADLNLPTFTRTKPESMMLFVDPNDASAPRMASIHVLFRNAVVLSMLGIIFICGSVLFRMKLRDS